MSGHRSTPHRASCGSGSEDTRSHDRVVEDPDASELSLAALRRIEQREAMVAAALEELDLEARQVFALRYRSLLRVEEIARAMNVSVRQVRMVLSSGYLIVRLRLAGHDPSFRSMPHVQLHRSIRKIRRSDLLPKLRRWAEATTAGELRERSDRRVRKARSVARRRALWRSQLDCVPSRRRRC